MADRTWKAFERRMARLFGTERIPAAGVMGRAQKDASDFRTKLFSFQAKKGYKFPAYLKAWLDGIVHVGAGESRYGVVIWSDKGARDADSLVLMRAADFAAIVTTFEELVEARLAAVDTASDHSRDTEASRSSRPASEPQP
jgi:hypothetical protein